MLRILLVIAVALAVIIGLTQLMGRDAPDAMSDMSDAIEETAEDAADAMGDAADAAGDMAGDAAAATGEAMENTGEAMGEAMDDAGDAMGDAMDEAGEMADDAMEAADEMADDAADAMEGAGVGAAARGRRRPATLKQLHRCSSTGAHRPAATTWGAARLPSHKLVDPWAWNLTLPGFPFGTFFEPRSPPVWA